MAHVGQDANQVAHRLAQLAKEEAMHDMHGNAPLEIRALVDSDRQEITSHLTSCNVRLRWNDSSQFRKKKKTI
jgi:hypothetical protein